MAMLHYNLSLKLDDNQLKINMTNNYNDKNYQCIINNNDLLNNNNIMIKDIITLNDFLISVININDDNIHLKFNIFETSIILSLNILEGIINDVFTLELKLLHNKSHNGKYYTLDEIQRQRIIDYKKNKNKKYYTKNKEKICKQQKIYNQLNKIKITEYKSSIYTCPNCKKDMRLPNKYRHECYLINKRKAKENNICL